MTGPASTHLTPPGPEELAAILAAVEVAWPRPGPAPEPVEAVSPWRFSGRWWARPAMTRRERPWVPVSSLPPRAR